MSTRGLYGFIEDGKYTANYNQSDSYPSGLGLEFWTSCKIGDWSEYYIEIDSIDFIKDSLFCEWAYFYDPDKELFEIWKGFQKEPDTHNPFGQKSDGNGYYPCKRIFRGEINSLTEDVFSDREDFDAFITSITRDNKLEKVLKK